MIYTDKMIWIYHKSSRALDVVFKLIVLSEQQLKKAQSRQLCVKCWYQHVNKLIFFWFNEDHVNHCSFVYKHANMFINQSEVATSSLFI